MKVAARIATHHARTRRVEIAAGRADADRGRRFAHRLAERLKYRLALLEQNQRRPACRTRTEPRQLRQELHKLFDFGTSGKRAHESGDHDSSVGGAISRSARSRTAT